MILSGRDIKWYIETGKLVIDPVEEIQFRENGLDLILENIEDRPTNFAWCEFVLGCTKERFEMPDDLMGFVELRSTWARTGLMIPPTIIDAGFAGNITLEIVSFNKKLPSVPYGQRFAHVIFAKMTSHGKSYAGKYQNQTGITGPKKDR